MTDPAGAAIPVALVTVRSVDTNIRKTGQASESGVYNVPLLLPGTYEVTVEAAGMQTQIRRDVVLKANATVTLDFRLALAQVATTVDVTGDVPLLQTETSNVGNTVDAKTIEEFPLQQRDIMGLVRTIPGVTAKSQVGDARGGRNVFDSNFSIGGGRTSTNEVLLDGAANTIGDFNGVVIVPPPDAVQEFRVEVNAFSAEFGRTGGGAVNIVTKSGSNAFHGSAYYYHQNDAFNANSFNNNRFGLIKPVVRRHQYGYSLGGPVLIPRLYNGKNKTFFFTAYEGRREKDPVTSITSVPTDAERAGDFSRTVYLTASGVQGITVFDPNTSRSLNGVRTRDPFPGNVIPADRVNPIARRVIGEYPAANRQGSTVTGRSNYAFRDSRSYQRDVFTGRLDHYFTGKHRLFGRFTTQANADVYPSKFVKFTQTNSIYDSFRNVGLDDTYQINPHLSTVFRYSYARFRANQRPNVTGFDPSSLGLPSYFRDQANVLYYPNFSLGDGTFPDIGGTAFNNQPRDTQGFQQNFVYVNGRHNVRFGGEYRLYRFYPFQVTNATGGFSFSRNFTQQDQTAAGRPDQGFSLASLMLGTGNFSFEHAEPITGFHHYAGAYVQDDWKLTSRLTLNLGLRWETETGTAESQNRISYFDPNGTNPIPNGPKGAIEFAGGSNAGTVREANLRNFGPRLGAAYRLTARTVFRGGYGLFYLPLGLEPAIVSTPYNYSVSADVSNADYTPKATLSDPFPGGIPVPASSKPPTDGSYRLNNNANITIRRQPAGYLQQWNFAIGRQLARTTVIDATYYGSRGVHLPIPSLELNQIDPKALAQGGAYLTELVPNPYYDYFRGKGGLLSQPTIPRMQLLKPFPQFASFTTANAYGGSLNYLRPPVGDSVYHAVTFRLERRFTKGFALTAHYTVSKLLDTGGVGNGAAFLDPSALRDILNTRLERSLGSFDVPQRLVVHYAVDIPVGKGRRFLNRGGWADRMIGGWSLFAFHIYESGLPVAIGGTDLSRIAGASPSRVSVVPGVEAAYPLAASIANARDYDPRCGCTKPWLNPAAFTSTPEFRIPNGPRFLPNIREGNLRNVDLTLTKSFRVWERWNVAVQGRAYNLLNQVTFNGPSVTSVTAANFGSAGGTRDNSRRLEVGARVTF